MIGMWKNIPTAGQNRDGGSKRWQRTLALKLHLSRCHPKQLENSAQDIRITSSIPHLIEIGHIGADKGKTLGHFLQMNGIAMDEAMAFGDAGNDISMLTAVRYGIAMENATDECKAAAYAVAEENNADGVAKMIRKYCL